MSKPMKKLLLICSNYWPEIAGIGLYSTDLAENAFSQFFEVTVLTGLPHYPWWKIPDVHKDKGPGIYQRNGVEVLRVGHAVPKSSGIFGRARLEFSFWRSARRAIRKIRPRGFDLVVAIMPTVASGLVARDFARRQGIAFQIVFQDISSVGAKQSGMPAAKWLANIPRILEKRAVRGAKAIAIVSPAMLQQVKKIAGQNVPVTLIHNYSLQPKSKISKIEGRDRLQFEAHEFIFLHTGNIGYKQDLLNVVAAGKLVKNKLIKIYIV